jgi:glycosyltransferase 2 family protein
MKPRPLHFSIGLACAFFFLALAFHRAPLATVDAILAHTDPLWIVAALCAYAIDLALRAWRWQIILRSVAAVSYATVLRVLLVGYGLNTIMPARLGELFRAEFFKKSYGLPRVPVLTSIVVERLFDGLAVVGCLAIGILLATRTGRPAATLIDAAASGGALFGGVLIVALNFGRLPQSRLVAHCPRLAEQIAAVESGFAVLRSRRGLQTALLTLIIYVPEALSAWLVVKAVGLTLGFADTAVLVGAASLGTLLPSGPAFLGTLQFAYLLAIEFAGGQATTGIAAATLVQLCILLPVAVLATTVFVYSSGNVLFASFTARHPNQAANRGQAANLPESIA